MIFETKYFNVSLYLIVFILTNVCSTDPTKTSRLSSRPSKKLSLVDKSKRVCSFKSDLNSDLTSDLKSRLISLHKPDLQTSLSLDSLKTDRSTSPTIFVSNRVPFDQNNNGNMNGPGFEQTSTGQGASTLPSLGPNRFWGRRNLHLVHPTRPLSLRGLYLPVATALSTDSIDNGSLGSSTLVKDMQTPPSSSSTNLTEAGTATLPDSPASTYLLSGGSGLSSAGFGLSSGTGGSGAPGPILATDTAGSLATMHDLLEWQWDQASSLLMQQAEGSDSQ
ncbi:unnamed protein product [Protopolystoma xenopodis]|uniref:Uncharacterized protein n=1 Tax=Protopolystoma xenopodis TaxID=117903 RepID=A0A3S5ARX4_9PLAT|nr:unnamed protein product [Protopolystoma xenopodis]